MASQPDVGKQQLPESKKTKRRHQLWAFQREIVQRTQNARDNTDNLSRRLAVKAGSEHVLLDLMQTGEILTNINLTPVPLTKTWFLGIANSRGSLFGVVDLAGFLGQPIAVHDRNDRLLIFANAISTHCAIRVSKVFGLIDTTTMSQQKLTPDGLRFSTQIYIDKESQRWTQLDLANMARDPTFLDINQ